MAPPASAMLAGGAAVAGIFTLVCLRTFCYLNCFFSLLVLVWKVHIKLHGVILVSYILFLSECIVLQRLVSNGV